MAAEKAHGPSFATFVVHPSMAAAPRLIFPIDELQCARSLAICKLLQIPTFQLKGRESEP